MFGLGGVFGPTSQVEHSPMNTTLVKLCYCCPTSPSMYSLRTEQKLDNWVDYLCSVVDDVKKISFAEEVLPLHNNKLGYKKS